MTESWVDGDDKGVGAHLPLHAGALIDLGYGNLDRLLSQSGHRFQCIPHDISTGEGAYCSHTMNTSSVWEDATPEWGGWTVLLRQKEGGGNRDVRVGMTAKMIKAGHVGTVRIAAFRGVRASVSFDTSDGFIGRDYIEMQFSTSSATTVFSTLTIGDDAISRRTGWAPTATDAPETQYNATTLHAIVMISSGSTGTSIDLFAPSITEVP